MLKELKNFIRELLAKSIDDDIESMKDEYVDSKLWNGKKSFLDDDMIRVRNRDSGQLEIICNEHQLPKVMERFYKDGIKMTHFEEWEEENGKPKICMCVFDIMDEWDFEQKTYN